MHTDTIGTFLAQAATRVPAPGGGATAALHADQAAALVAMVARYSDSATFDDHAEEIGTITATANRQRENALGLAEEDARPSPRSPMPRGSRRGRRTRPPPGGTWGS